MALVSLRRYEVQARYGLLASLISVLPFVGAVYLVISRFNTELQQIVYGSGGKFVLSLLVCLFLSGIPAAVGFLLGWNSAGHRRNEKSAQSWSAFFLGGAILTGDAILFIAFFWLGLEQIT